MNRSPSNAFEAALPDRGLALATYALQLGLINRDQLIHLLQFWLQDTSQSLTRLLLEQKYLSSEDHAILEGLVTRHLRDAVPVMEDSFRLSAPIASGNLDAPALRSEPLRPGQQESAEVARSIVRTLRDQTDRDRSRPLQLSVLNVSHERFRILRPYALGGLGIVSVAHDIELDREVAIKEIRPDGELTADEMQRFMAEARVTGQLDHPGIPPVYALGYFEDGRPFYVMRLIEGQTLRDAIKQFHARHPYPDRSRERTLQLRYLLGAIVSVCHTLRFAHARGVLHRDIKPSNIMLGEYGETLVLDWGLAKSREQAQPFSTVEAKVHYVHQRRQSTDETGTGSVMGTPHYMSPEQATGQVEQVNIRSDVYSVGATLYHLLTGKPPYAGLKRDEILSRVPQGGLTRPCHLDSRVPRELEAICLKAMALERADRFAHTGELALELEHWLADEPVRCYREPLVKQWVRWLKVRQVWVASILVLSGCSFIALAVVALIVSLAHQESIRLNIRADQEAARAQKLQNETQELITNWIVIGINDLLNETRGTEKSQLKLLEESIDLLAGRVSDSPYDTEVIVDYAIALAAKSRIHTRLGDLDTAWQELVEANEVLDSAGPSTNDATHGYLVINRISLNLQICQYLRMYRPNTPETDQFIAEISYWLQAEYNRSPDNVAVKLAYAECCLIRAGFELEHAGIGSALEEVERALTILGQLEDDDKIAARIAQGQKAVKRILLDAMISRTAIALLMRDITTCEINLRAAKDLIRQMQVDYPELSSLDVLMLEIELSATLLERDSSHAPDQYVSALLKVLGHAERLQTTHFADSLIKRARSELGSHFASLGRFKTAIEHLQAHLLLDLTARTAYVMPDALPVSDTHTTIAEMSLMHGDWVGYELHALAAMNAFSTR